MRVQAASADAFAPCLSSPTARSFLLLGVLLGVALGRAGAESIDFAPTRRFPDSSSTIRVFVDQLDGSGMTDAQSEFAATHYVGTQKQLPGEIDAVRAFNPDFIMLQYRLGVRASTPPFIHNGVWSSDFSTVDAHEDWFVHTNGTQQRVYQNVGSIREYVMDISGQINGNTTAGWKEYWARTVIADVDASHADGVFADSTHLPYAVPSNLWNSPIGGPPHTAYISHMEAFYDYAYSQFDAANKYFIPNIGSLVTTVDTTRGYYEDVHGAMVEGFGVRLDLNGPYANLAEETWQMQQNRVLRLIGNDKIYIAETVDSDIASFDDVASRLWYMSNFLLLKHDKSFINMFPGGHELAGQLHWWPEYELELGPPVESATPGGIGFDGDIGSLRDAGGIYSRSFERGLVLVNPSSETRTFLLDDDYRLVEPFGGGLVGPDGQAPDGGLTLTPVGAGQFITLGPQSGTILLTIPEPSAGVLGVTGLLCFVAYGRGRKHLG